MSVKWLKSGWGTIFAPLGYWLVTKNRKRIEKHENKEN